MTYENTAFLSPDLFTDRMKSIPIRDGFGEGLLKAGEENASVVVLSADLKDSTRAGAFADAYPDRFIECGVAEAGMITIASGLAASGKIPFACSFAAFSPGRTWEQIRTTICLNDVPVKIAGLFGGVSVGPDGATHQMLEDIALMRSLPNMIVIAPSDAIEARKATIAAVRTRTPVYLRIPRAASAVYTTEQTPFEIGKANLLKDGNDITIIACGAQVATALSAAAELERESISAAVINLHTIKPLDTETILASVKTTQRVITIEDHQITGGMGSAVAEFLSAQYPVKVVRMGIQDTFGQSGSPAELYEAYGLTPRHLFEAAKAAIQK